MSIAENLLGPFFQRDDHDGVVQYEPEDDARVSRIKAIRGLILKETPLWSRWQQAEGRTRLTDEQRLELDRYVDDTRLRFDSVDFGRTRGLEMLSESCFGGFFGSSFPIPRTDNPKWNDWGAIEHVQALDWERKRNERWQREDKKPVPARPSQPPEPVSSSSKEPQSPAAFGTTTQITLPAYVATAMLLWALLPFNPYGYYIVLRWACCAVLLYYGLKAWNRKLTGWSAALVLLSMVYNPISRVPLTRSIWTVINIATIVLLLVFTYRSKSERSAH